MKNRDNWACRKCAQVYAPSDSQFRNGTHLCPPCLRKTNAEAKERLRAKGYSQHKARDAGYLERRRQYEQSPRRQELRRLRAKSPEEQLRNSARWLAWYAAKTGAIQKLPCQKCGSPKVHAHHHDYRDPLNVTWLCVKCHTHTHLEAGDLARSY